VEQNTVCVIMRESTAIYLSAAAGRAAGLAQEFQESRIKRQKFLALPGVIKRSFLISR
jgi:hypothetical protein